MAFKDSHNKWEPIIGYGWEQGWYLDQNRDFRLGLGLTAAVTARQDFANYVPLPVVLPLLSASYKQASVQFTYIRGTYNNGNVLFTLVPLRFLTAGRLRKRMRVVYVSTATRGRKRRCLSVWR